VELVRGLVMGEIETGMVENALRLLIFGTLAFIYAVIKEEDNRVGKPAALTPTIRGL